MTTITEDYVSFEIAKLLKEKGFNEPVTELNRLLCKEGEKPVLRITHQKAMKWLRESHNLQIQITPITSRHKDWTFGIDIDFSPLTIDLLCFPTYEEAVEAALKYSLENLI